MIRDVPGFLSKAWLHNGASRGGFYLFTDEAATRADTDGPVVGSVLANPAFDDVQVRAFAVDTDLSARTALDRTHASNQQEARAVRRRSPLRSGRANWLLACWIVSGEFDGLLEAHRSSLGPHRGNALLWLERAGGLPQIGEVRELGWHLATGLLGERLGGAGQTESAHVMS
jgi:hypothetical protein